MVQVRATYNAHLLAMATARTYPVGMDRDSEIIARVEEDLKVLTEVPDLVTRRVRRLQVSRGTLIDALGVSDEPAFAGSVTIEELTVRYRVDGEERELHLDAKKVLPADHSAGASASAVSRATVEASVSWSASSAVSTEEAARISRIQTLLREAKGAQISTVKIAESVLGELPEGGPNRLKALAKFRELMEMAQDVDPAIWAPTRKSWAYRWPTPQLSESDDAPGSDTNQVSANASGFTGGRLME